MPNIKYSIEQADGSIVVRSTVKSFNLDHVVDKDITSYYRQISNQALFDTGLLPLNGTGVLSIRSAGRHTQIAFQHAPTMAYINWGKHEGDPTAKAYLLAQPYRIWVADLLDGNLYGARMFYSPYAINHPDQPLYHVNLPNTNCKGYRGNGVGWQCLYHNEDWSKLSFNEKIDKLIQRCSGIEAYNDSNMSETDGPRFYRENNKPEYLWNPLLWQEKSQNEGVDWTLDEDLWIPILVKDIDNQDKHEIGGQPLTFAMALLGKYNSYYHDDNHPKLVNAFARPDIDIPTDKIFDIFAQAHNSAKTEPYKFDQFNTASLNKVKIAETFVQPSLFDQEEDDNNVVCVSCEDLFNQDSEHFVDPAGNDWCQGCFEEYWVYCDNTEEYLHCEDDDCMYIESESIYIDVKSAEVKECQECYAIHWIPKDSNQSFPFYEIELNDEILPFCPNCFADKVAPVLNLEPTGTIGNNSSYHGYEDNCSQCSVTIFKDIPALAHYSVCVKTIHPDFSKDLNLVFGDQELPYENWIVANSYICTSCAKKMQYCSSGHWSSFPQVSIVPWISKPFDNKIDNTHIILKVKNLCSGCCNSNYDFEDSSSIPFKNKKLLSQAIAAVQHQISPAFSPGFELFNLDGTSYSPEPF